MPGEFLWDTRMLQKLIQPTAFYGDDSSEKFTYIGRARAQDLLRTMQDLRRGGSLQIQGVKGSGKSTAVCALVGYMIGKLNTKVVYICASRFIESPVKVVRHALLVATGCDESVARLRKFNRLDNWCSAHMRDQLLFVVDDWDEFENFPEEKAMLEDMVLYHILVKLSSTSSRERRIFAASDKPLPTFDFDGPYTPEELQTWIGHSTVPQARLRALDCLTGGMPGLLRFYEEVGGNAQRYMAKIEVPYTSKLFEKVIGLQTTKKQLASAIEMVTTGVRGIGLKEPVDLTCFYEEGYKFKILSPYLRSRAEYYIMEQEKALQSGLEYAAFQAWAAAVRMDCITAGRNPARTGWNVEGLIIAVMRYQGKMWNGLPFACCKTYERGGEAALLRMLTRDELGEGVLVAPVAFNERAVEVMYLKLDLETGVLTIKVVQITVAKWKHKRRERSQKVWQEEIIPRCSEQWSVQHQFIYVMPRRLNQNELQYVDRDLCSYINACHTAEDADGGVEDAEDAFLDAQYGTEQYDGNLNRVTSQPTDFKILGDVHRCLDDFKGIQDEPVPPVKQQVRQCGGQVLENDQWRRSRTDEDVYYCCPTHAAQRAN